MPDPIVVIGVPTALGGHLAGMERAPAELRRLGIIRQLGRSPALAEAQLRDCGNVVIEPGFRADPDRRARNRVAIAAFLPREAEHVVEVIRSTGPRSRPLVLGGDCTAHAGALSGLRRARPNDRLAIAWFDAHGDFNTPDTTPSGNVWGMPFAMLCGIGDGDLVAACDGPTVDPHDATLVGSQVLDQQESRMLVRAGVAHFGSAMLRARAGQEALQAWARVKRDEVDGLYVAVDLDVLDSSGGWAVQMPEPGGLSLAAASGAIAGLRRLLPIVGFGATGINLDNGDARRTRDAIVRLAAAALAGSSL